MLSLNDAGVKFEPDFRITIRFEDVGEPEITAGTVPNIVRECLEAVSRAVELLTLGDPGLGTADRQDASWDVRTVLSPRTHAQITAVRPSLQRAALALAPQWSRRVPLLRPQRCRESGDECYQPIDGIGCQ